MTSTWRKSTVAQTTHSMSDHLTPKSYANSRLHGSHNVWYKKTSIVTGRTGSEKNLQLQAIRRFTNKNKTTCRLPKGPINAVFCAWWPWPKGQGHRGQKLKLVWARDQNVFRVNMAQIHSAVPEIFHTQTKKTPQTHSVKNRIFRSSLHAVIILQCHLPLFQQLWLSVEVADHCQQQNNSDSYKQYQIY